MTADPGAPAQDLLDIIVVRFEQDDVPDEEALPERRYLGSGSTDANAEDEPDPLNPKGSLMVAQQRLDTTVHAGNGVGAGSLTSHDASYEVRLKRPFVWFNGQGPLPTGPQVTRDARIVSRDALRLSEALHAWAMALKEQYPHMTVQWGPITTVAPRGGLAGNRVTASLGPL